MAINFPEPKQITIVIDYISYCVASGIYYTSGFLSSPSVVSGYKGHVLDHNPATDCVFDTNASTDASLVMAGNDGSGGREGVWYAFLDHTNLHTADSDNTKCSPYFQNASGGNQAITGIYNISGGRVNGAGLCVFKSSASTTLRGVVIDKESGGFSADLGIKYLHTGLGYTLPSNSTSQINFNSRYNNKVQRNIGGHQFSTLKNKGESYIISAEWDFIKWGGDNDVEDYLEIPQYTLGSHLPVGLILNSTDASALANEQNYLFARITKWEISQTSVNSWKVSAEFTSI